MGASISRPGPPSRWWLAAAATLLSACGGAVSISLVFFEDDAGDLGLRRSGLAASLTVSGATDARIDGGYASGDTLLSEVQRFLPPGEPSTCRFRFAGLLQAGGARDLQGEVRYVADRNDVRGTFVAIDGLQFRMDGGVGVALDRLGNTVSYRGAVLPATAGDAGQVTLTGTIPLPAARATGC